MKMGPKFNVLPVICSLLMTLLRVSADSHLSPCTPSLDTPQCLTAVRQLMANDSRFYFGSSYNSTCPITMTTFSTSCISPDREHLSIITRMRQNDDNSVDVIQQVLNVTYNVPAGSYQACENTYTVEAVTQTVDPTHTTDIPLWSANHVPQVSWRSEVNKSYALIVWDAAAFILHGFMFNIMGPNLDQAQTAWNYRGPRPPTDRDQPYVFLLFEQNSQLDPASVRDLLLTSFPNGATIAPNGIISALALTGPVGVSVLQVKTDPFATEFIKSRGLFNDCPALLTPVFSGLPLSYNVSDVTLMSSIDVNYVSPEISFRACCKDVTVVANSRIANPMGESDVTIPPVYTRSPPQVTFVQTSMSDNWYYLRSLYTLLMLDVTEELTEVTNPNTILHWQVVNIREGDVMSGAVTQTYKQPMPSRGDGVRVMMFLLLRQSAEVNVTDLARFAGDSCSQSLRERCRFNITAFITAQRMQIEGACWFRTSIDAYSRQQSVAQYPEAEEFFCSGVAGYANPCPCISSSTRTRESLSTSWLTGLLLILFMLSSLY